MALSLLIAPWMFHLLKRLGPALLQQLRRKAHPSVERCSTFFAAATRSNPHSISHSFERVAEPDFLLVKKARKANVVGSVLGFRSTILGFDFSLHGAFLT
jgi:hypothetical protein